MINCTYIHIPFCLTKCNYCSFCSYRLLDKKNVYIDSLIKEIKFCYKNEMQNTIYFGGGTPSLLEINDLKRILNEFNYNKNTEITIEINPYNIDYQKILSFKKIGINRVSVGIQNFDNNILKLIGRQHTQKDIYSTIENIKKAGFKNISIDLMYGLPTQTINNWQNMLKKAIDLEIQHISLYGLKIEKGTYFYKHTPKNLPNDDMQAKMYESAIDILKDKFIQYEFSNFGKNNKYFSKHNLAYWNRESYYGFGLSASGFINNKRYTNTFNFSEYIKNPAKKEYQKLTIQESIEEEIFLGLRKITGINFKQINKKYNIDIYRKYDKIFDKYLNLNYMKKTDNGVCLTTKGILISNVILSEFID